MPGLELELKTQIARAMGLQKKFAEAAQLLDEVESQLQAATPSARTRFLLERGRLLRSSGDSRPARPLFEEAWSVALGAGLEALAVDAAHMVAMVAEAGEAGEWNERALEIAEASEDGAARRWRGSLLNNLGWTCHDRGAFPEALIRFEQALKVRLEEGDVGQVRVARWCVARALRSLGRTEEALDEQRGLQEELASAQGAPDGYVLEELAECLHALGRTGEARPWFAAAFEVLSVDPWLPESQPQRLRRLARLGKAD